MSELLDFLAGLLRRGADHLAAFLIGAGVALIAWFFWVRPFSLRRYRKELQSSLLANARLESSSHIAGEQLAQAQSRLRQSGETVRELTDELEQIQSDAADYSAQVFEKNGEIAELTAQIKELDHQLDQITRCDGEVWLRPPDGHLVPPFRPLHTGRPPIVAVVNFKGGVGKTTTTANLAAAAFGQGQRVLLADLDYQSSLTSLCLPPAVIEDLTARRRFVEELLGRERPAGELAIELSTRIGEASAWLLATGENLSNVEMESLARWITRSANGDVRYRLRHALHHEAVAGQFDLVLVDCPPRLSTACINALAACDHVLVPVILDQLSAEAVPRLLRWLRKLKYESRVCPDFTVLGLVANKVHNTAGPSTRQQAVWDSLADRCRDAWQEPVHRFATTIPQSVKFAQAAAESTFAALHDPMQSKFRDLLEAMLGRMPAHERRRTAVVPA